LDQRAARYRRRLAALQDSGDGTIVLPPALESALSARHLVIDVQREELLRWRDAGRLPDTSLRILERELDHEEYALGPSAGPR
jgi:CPA1 family monovalent cation:H+ antiporter